MLKSQSQPNMYDLIYPSPVTLKEIASIAVSAQLWCFEINKYHQNGTLADEVSLKESIPDLPSVINNTITQYIKVFGESMLTWLHAHFEQVFSFHRDSENKILNDFYDFVCDWDGSIHYDRTAKRMMICDRLSEEEKFKIACMYCFEDDIKRIWPSVSAKIDINDYDFDTYPHLCYWICVMKNQFDLIPNEEEEPIEEIMLFQFYDRKSDWSSVIYFWDHITPENQRPKIVDLYHNYGEVFIRFLLPKLSEQLVIEFLAQEGEVFMHSLLFNSCKQHLIFPIWMFVKDKLPESAFIAIIEIILEDETRSFKNSNDTNLYCELWKSAPDNLKQSALKNILSKGVLFEKGSRFDQNCICPEYRYVKFLLTMLLDATFDKRSEFWHKNWSYLITWTRNEDLYQMMKVCLQNENDIFQFKETTLCKFVNIDGYCVELLKGGHFKELDDFLNFCTSNIQTKRTWKQHLLQTCFLGEDSILNDTIVEKAKLMHEFICNAYETENQAAEFKHQFISSPQTERCICVESVRLGSFLNIIDFVGTFEPTDQIQSRMKNSFVDYFKDWLETGYIWKFDSEIVQKFLIWCLGSEDRVTKFKQTMSAEKVLNSMVEQEADGLDRSVDLVAYPYNLDEFLKWFFISFEKIQEFKQQFADVFKMLAPKRGN